MDSKKIFINDAFMNGLKNYLKKIGNQPIDNIHIFEMRVIECLIKIYGEINIINPYKLFNEKEFKSNLSFYGMKDKEIDNFFSLMDDYENWLNSTNNSKNEIINDIESILIQMILLKSLNDKLSDDEINYYDNFFNPQNGDLKRIHSIVSDDPNYIKNLWLDKKSSIEHDSIVNLVPIDPVLLTDDKYEKFGLDIKEVEQLSNLKIEEINKKIESESSSSDNGGRKKTKPLQLVLTSGSGFVDTIVLLSVMTTEIMIGLLIAFTIARG